VNAAAHEAQLDGDGRAEGATYTADVMNVPLVSLSVTVLRPGLRAEGAWPDGRA